MTWALAIGILGIVWMKSALEDVSVSDTLQGIFTEKGSNAGTAGFGRDLIGELLSGGGATDAPDATAKGGPKPEGIGMYKGTRVCKWLIPILQEAEKHGWDGQLNSGYRSVAEQAAACAGTSGPCAPPGQSNHQGKKYPSCYVRRLGAVVNVFASASENSRGIRGIRGAMEPRDHPARVLVRFPLADLRRHLALPLPQDHRRHPEVHLI